MECSHSMLSNILNMDNWISHTGHWRFTVSLYLFINLKLPLNPSYPTEKNDYARRHFYVFHDILALILELFLLLLSIRRNDARHERDNIILFSFHFILFRKLVWIIQQRSEQVILSISRANGKKQKRLLTIRNSFHNIAERAL